MLVLVAFKPQQFWLAVVIFKLSGHIAKCVILIDVLENELEVVLRVGGRMKLYAITYWKKKQYDKDSVWSMESISAHNMQKYNEKPINLQL